MSYGKHLNKASSFFFLTGFLAAKVQYLPFYLFSVITNIFSSACYLIGYLLWLVASLVNPESIKHKDFWYGFASFNTQHKYAAYLGLTATICFFVAISSPFIAIPAAWLFASSNLFWCVAEFHKLKFSPKSSDYSANYQSNYLQYAALMTAVSLITALSVTCSMLFPLAGFAILTGSAILSLVIGIQALNCWITANMDDHKPDYELVDSYTHMSENLLEATPKNMLSHEESKINEEVRTFQPLFAKSNLSLPEPIIVETPAITPTFYS
ncbi:Uncharacterised protein [Legionella beliardensis]|uniref:Transmembrane protein n=1 Tax=Legionella beliardensis TaxID=91822 RepID=A0A378I2A1_9GAMM|nr:hypothetical protein [Legionella beliardensis]STX28776.1 Uncharacterised protein [Legionella beliardensis]